MRHLRPTPMVEPLVPLFEACGHPCPLMSGVFIEHFKFITSQFLRRQRMKRHSLEGVPFCLRSKHASILAYKAARICPGGIPFP
jgi:hypothetical protein